MKEQIVMDILREMTAILTQEQLMRLKEVVRVQLCGYDIRKKETTLMRTDQNWLNYLQMYLDGFRQNGKSTGTIEQYNLHLSRMLSYVAKNVQDIEDDDLISYMYKYRALRKVSNRYLNNMRLVFNSFFRWLQRRKVIFRNPVDGLEPIKYKQDVKKPLSPEELEKVRCACEQERDLAIVEFLYSSAVRVSELCQLNRDDICWESDDVMVLGKGNKEREVYLNARAHLHLKQYLESRTTPDKIRSQKYPKKDRECSGGKQSASAQVPADIGNRSAPHGHADRAGARAFGACQNRDDANLLYSNKGTGTGITSSLYGNMM